MYAPQSWHSHNNLSKTKVKGLQVPCDVALQPIVWASDGAIFGYEALARPKCRTAPEEYFSKLGIRERAEVDFACRSLALRTMQSNKLSGFLSLNIHPQILTNAKYGAISTLNFAHHIGVSKSRVIFEITEQHEFEVTNDFKECLERIRNEGARIALDDFGAGHNGIARLIQLEPEIVKFDALLTAATAKDGRHARLVCDLAEACSSFGSLLVAEGVEREEECISLKNSFQLLQGYYCGAPKIY